MIYIELKQHDFFVANRASLVTGFSLYNSLLGFTRSLRALIPLMPKLGKEFHGQGFLLLRVDFLLLICVINELSAANKQSVISVGKLCARYTCFQSVNETNYLG